MGTMVRCSYVVVLIACGLFWMFYVPFPPEYDYPIILKVAFSAIEIAKTMAAINCAFGGSFADPFSIGDKYQPEILGGLTVSRTEIGDVEVALYKPIGFGEKNLGPAMIYLHGGGFTIGSINTHAGSSMAIAKGTGMLVIVPEYRLAPKHIFPAAFDDALAVTKGLLLTSGSYGVDPKKVVLAGDSAGGNLAAAVALSLGKDRTSHPLCMINLIYPTLQIVNFRLPSSLQNPNGPMLDNWFKTSFVLNYIGYGQNLELLPLLLKNAHMENYTQSEILDRIDEKWVPARYKIRKYLEKFEIVPEEGYETLRENLQKIQYIATDTRLSVLAADDASLSLLPRTHIVTCEYDPLRDDGVILHERIKRLGLNSSFTNWEFGVHGIFSSYGSFSYDKLDSAVNEMLDVVLMTVQNC